MDHDHDPDFWEDLLMGQQTRTASSLDLHLQRREEAVARQGLRALTDKGRLASALPFPSPVGTRVAFVTNLGSVLSYADPPAPDSEGTVVMVRTAEGDQTGSDGHVFVKFDDGRFVAIHHEHLRKAANSTKLANNFTRRVSHLGDLSDFLRAEPSGTDLVHKSTRDLWSCSKTDQGEFVLSRLFNDTGTPLKV